MNRDTHPGHIASAGLKSPEFQITNDTSVIGISTFFHYVVREGFKWEEGKPLTPDYSAFTRLASNPAQLIDQLNLVMTARRHVITAENAADQRNNEDAVE